jgi:hypothetical protein
MDLSQDNARRAGDAVFYIDAVMHGWRDVGVVVVGLSIRSPRHEHDDFFVTVRGVDAEGARWVAFHTAMTLMDLLRGVAARMKNGSFKWKEDTFER